MAKITDIQVVISTSHPAIAVGTGVPAIFVKGDTAGKEQFTSLETLETKYANTTDVYKAAAAYFAQPNAGAQVEVITYVASTKDDASGATTGGIASAAEDYYWDSWHFAVMATYAADDALELSNYIESQSEKFFVVQQEKVADLATFAKNTRTILLVHHDSTERFDMAVLGRVANQDVGSVTWKSKGELVGVTADEVTSTEFQAIEDAHAISYIVKGNEPVTSNGWTASGDWIDQLHGIDWVKENIESALQEYLNTQDKVPFSDAGFALLETQVRGVLENAYDQGIIAYDATNKAGQFSVTADAYADLSADDIKKRQYNGIHWTYTPSDAVQAMKVSGVIEYAA